MSREIKVRIRDELHLIDLVYRASRRLPYAAFSSGDDRISFSKELYKIFDAMSEPDSDE